MAGSNHTRDGRNAPGARAAGRRRAITLLEVLISMGVLTIGILGVAALFPVGSHYARRGELYDRADAAAAAAFNDAVTRGLLNPNRWVMHNHRLVASGGEFTGNYVSELRRIRAEQAQAEASIAGPALVAQVGLNNNIRNRVFGSAVVVDPLGVSSGVEAASSYFSPIALSSVPSAILNAGLTAESSLAGNPILTQPNWYPWADLNPSPWVNCSPLRRVTLRAAYSDASATLPVSDAVAAENSFVEDDLSFDLGDAADRPAQQLVLPSNWGVVGRLSKREFSYFLTVIPTTPDGRDALAFGGQGKSYVVSAAVFSRRQTGGKFDSADNEFFGHEELMRGERLASARVLTSSPSGGEIELQAAGDLISAKYGDDELPWKDLRPGRWALLHGPHPASTPAKPLMFARWYRVVALEEQQPTAGHAWAPNLPTAAVALRGPDWPWAPGTPISAGLRLAIFPEVVAVHSRTLQLQAGSGWSESFAVPSGDPGSPSWVSH